MSTRNSTILRLVAVLALAACGGSADPLPRQVIVGDFGAANGLIHADAQSATVDLGCSLVQINAPLLTDDHGDFALTRVSDRALGGPLRQCPAKEPRRCGSADMRPTPRAARSS